MNAGELGPGPEGDSTCGGMIYLDGKSTGHKLRGETERRVMRNLGMTTPWPDKLELDVDEAAVIFRRMLLLQHLWTGEDARVFRKLRNWLRRQRR